MVVTISGNFIQYIYRRGSEVTRSKVDFLQI